MGTDLKAIEMSSTTAKDVSTTLAPPLQSFASSQIQIGDCIAKCNLVLENVQSQVNNKRRLTQYHLHFTVTLLEKANLALEKCNAQIQSYLNFNLNLDDWAAFQNFLYDQRFGLIIGSLSTLFSCFFDQRLASHYAKKNDIKLKACMKFAFSTLMAFVIILLRKRNPNSRVAQFLSDVKKKDNVCSTCSKKSRKQASTPDNRPKPFQHPQRRHSDSVRHRFDTRYDPSSFILHEQHNTQRLDTAENIDLVTIDIVENVADGRSAGERVCTRRDNDFFTGIV